MARLRIEPAKASHIRPIAARMRKADADEVMAASGRSPASALAYSFRKSTGVWTAFFDDVPAVMFGVGDINILTNTGAPWLLGTDAVETNFRTFLRMSPYFRDQLLSRYSVLRNLVDVRNTISVRWLEWLGFEFSDTIDVRGHEFRLFELRSAYV